jgi:lysophospholipase L1-like esterase
VLYFLIISILSCAQIPQAQPDWTVRPDNPNLTYSGRWDFTNHQAPWCDWQGASISMNFNGTGIGIALDPGTRENWYRAILDYDIENSIKFSVSPGGIRKTILFNSLTPGQHHIRVVKETRFGNETTFLGFGGVNGIGITAPPPPPNYKIEFYGDSNLAGYSLEHEENNSDNQYRGCELTYAGIVARRFNAEYHNISVSGETISGMNSRFDQMKYASNNPVWDFNRYNPDLVVVNLGANDVWKPVSWIRADYNDFLDDLRQVHPNAHIMLFNAFGWDFNETANYISDVITNRNDSNMSAATFPWLFEQWHGCETDHAGMAEYLAQHIETELGWSPQQSDIVSGFGQNGDVANGSFEEIAPFGGFGWRYAAHRSNVQRIENNNYAHEGDYFIILNNGGSIQQPNPASNGQHIEVEVWLRGATNNDVAEITIDFRNQEMYTSPLQTQTWSRLLTTSWTKHTFNTTAPTNNSTPVFHTRLTIRAANQCRIGVDKVSMSTQ